MKLDDYEARISELSEKNDQASFDDLLALDREIRCIAWSHRHQARAKSLADKAFAAARSRNPSAQPLYRYNATPESHNNPVS